MAFATRALSRRCIGTNCTTLFVSPFSAKKSTARAAKPLFDIESDLQDGILGHVPVTWTDAFREAEQLGNDYTETMGVRGADLLHVGIA